MNRKIIKKIIGVILYGLALYLALYVGVWLLVIKGCLDILKNISLCKVIVGGIKVFIIFPTVEYYASIIATVGHSFIKNNEEIN